MSAACYEQLVLPEWWDCDCDTDEGCLQDLMVRVMRLLRCSAEQARACMQGKVNELSLTHSPQVKLKRIKRDTAGEHVSTTIRLCEELASKLSRAFSEESDLEAAEDMAAMRVRERALQVRQEVLRHGTYVDLHSLLDYCTEKGIIVAHFRGVPGGKIDGAAINNEGHPVIILGSSRTDMWIPYHLAHELGHILLQHGATYFCELRGEADNDKQEQEANEFAEYLLLGEQGKIRLPQLMGRSVVEDRRLFIYHGRKRWVAPELLALFAAHEQNRNLYGYVNKIFTTDSKTVHDTINNKLKSRIEDLDIGMGKKDDIFCYLDYCGK